MAYDGLDYGQDERKDPEGRRRANFKQGWTRAVNERDYVPDTLDELTWNNLGWRVGKLFGDTPDDLRDELFEWCVVQRDTAPKD